MYRPIHRLFPLLLWCCCLALLFAACASSAVFQPSQAQPHHTDQAYQAINCPASGRATRSVLPSLTQKTGSHAAIIYAVNEGVGTSSTAALMRYDTATGQRTTIVRLRGRSIFDAQVSTDGQWVLFMSVRAGVSPNLQGLHLIRTDGQYFQTLYCNENMGIINARWSPDQKLVVFRSSPGIYLLNISNGQIQLVLANAPPDLPLFPRMWLDDTHVYLDNVPAGIAEPSLLGDLTTLAILDTSRGANQRVQNLTAVFHKAYPAEASWYPCYDFAGIPHDANLFFSQCQATATTYRHELVARGGPSNLSILSSTGSQQKHLMTIPNLPIVTIRPVDQSSTGLLLLVDNAADSGQNGLWFVNVDGSQLVHLQVDDPGQHSFLNPASYYSWSNVSRDGTMFALQVMQDASNTDTLLFGSLRGGRLTTLATIQDVTGTRLAIAGWTTT